MPQFVQQCGLLLGNPESNAESRAHGDEHMCLQDDAGGSERELRQSGLLRGALLLVRGQCIHHVHHDFGVTRRGGDFETHRQTESVPPVRGHAETTTAVGAPAVELLGRLVNPDPEHAGIVRCPRQPTVDDRGRTGCGRQRGYAARCAADRDHRGGDCGHPSTESPACRCVSWTALSNRVVHPCPPRYAATVASVSCSRGYHSTILLHATMWHRVGAIPMVASLVHAPRRR